MSYRMSRFTHARQQKGVWGQPEPAIVYSWGKLGKSSLQPRSETHSEHLVRTTPPPQKYRQQPWSLETWALVAAVVGLVLGATFWLCWGLWPR